MQLNATTCYAMQIVLYLARNKRIVSSAELAESLKVSQRYTLKIAGLLRDGGLTDVQAGMRGGYSLTREASEISAYDVITLMEGEMSILECLTPNPDCGEACKNTHQLSALGIVKDYLDAFLKRLTFDKLADMGISEKLDGIIGLAESHIESILGSA